jgi:ABC-type Fe3+-citrate transport system substrate-binding protein
MKKNKIFAILLILVLLLGVTGCGSSSSSSSKSWEKDANKAGYYKKNGKWYYQGKGAN